MAWVGGFCSTQSISPATVDALGCSQRVPALALSPSLHCALHQSSNAHVSSLPRLAGSLGVAAGCWVCWRRVIWMADCAGRGHCIWYWDSALHLHVPSIIVPGPGLKCANSQTRRLVHCMWPTGNMSVLHPLDASCRETLAIKALLFWSGVTGIPSCKCYILASPCSCFQSAVPACVVTPPQRHSMLWSI